MGLFDFAGALFQGYANKRSQNRQNEFNARQAELDRQFQSQEAQIARDWQEEQYNLYSSPSAMVSQYQDAGLNPALMYGQNLQSSTGSSPTPSGSMASGSPLGAGMPTGNVIEAVAGLAKLKSEIDNINADTDAKKADALLKGSSVELNQSIKSLNSSQMNKIESEIGLIKEQAKTEQQKQNAIIIENALKVVQRKQIEFSVALSEQFKKVTGVSADSQTIGFLMLSASNIISSVTGNGFGFLKGLFSRKKADKLKIPKLSEVTGNVE